MVIHIRLLFEEIQPPAHSEEKESRSVGAYQIEVGREPMAILRLAQFAVTHPLQVECNHSLKRIINTTLLLECHRLALAIMSEKIQNGGHFAASRFWFVKQGGGPKPWDDLIPKLSNAVTFG